LVVYLDVVEETFESFVCSEDYVTGVSEVCESFKFGQAGVCTCCFFDTIYVDGVVCAIPCQCYVVPCLNIKGCGIRVNVSLRDFGTSATIAHFEIQGSS
jgi:hypothetical protein